MNLLILLIVRAVRWRRKRSLMATCFNYTSIQRVLRTGELLSLLLLRVNTRDGLFVHPIANRQHFFPRFPSGAVYPGVSGLPPCGPFPLCRLPQTHPEEQNLRIYVVELEHFRQYKLPQLTSCLICMILKGGWTSSWRALYCRQGNSSSSSLFCKCALRESGCRIGYESTKMSRDVFRRSISRDTNVEASAFLPS